MAKYSIIAEVTMDNGEIYLSKRFHHIGDDTNNIIHGRMLDMNYDELNKDYEDSNLVIFTNEIKEFVEDYFMEKLNLNSNSDMESFKFIFVDNDTDEYSHYIEMKTNIKYIDYDITVHKIENEEVINKCIENINGKDATMTISKIDGDYPYLKMNIDEIVETSEYYCFKQRNNEFKIEKSKVKMVRIVDGDTENYIWYCKNDTIIEIK